MYPRHTKTLICIAGLLLFFGNVKAQLQPDFGADITSGCAPIAVVFSDSSSPGVTSRQWDFGNGNTATGNNPVVTATYTTPGTYTVKLIVSDGFQTDSIVKTAFIRVFDEPNTSLAVLGPTTGCVPLTVSFQNNSTPTTAPIDLYKWDFGDGSPLVNVPAGAPTPNHTYVFPGIYSIGLTAIDTNGCQSSTLVQNVITADPKPTAAFTADTTSICQPPLSVQFVNQSIGAAPLSYTWNLALGTSTQQNPQQTYTAPGGYTISLTVVDGNGCSDTLIEPNYVAIGSVIANFTVPPSVCANSPYTFANTSFGGNSFVWDFGGGDTSHQKNAVHIFPAAGTYSVTLTADAGPGCRDSITQTIIVEDIQADFTSAVNYACDIPHQVTYTDQTPGNVASWEWRFGNVQGVWPNYISNISTQQNPSNTFFAPGYYDDTLIVTSTSGCIDTIIKPSNVYIFVPIIDISADETQGCAPLTVNFTDLSTPQDSLISWQWDFGDGSPFSNQPNPTHTYTQPGSYLATLTVTTNSGCQHSQVIQITTGQNQQPGFFVDTLVLCSIDSFQFTNTSQDTNLIDSYSWSFGPNTTSSDFEPKIAIKDTGYINVTLITNDNGCRDTLTIDSLVRVLGPISDFDYIVDCANPYDIQLRSASVDFTDRWWGFADGSPVDSVFDTLTHTYAARGNYRVRLVNYNSNTGCYDTVRNVVAVRDIEACFSLSDTTPCKEDVVVADAMCSQDAARYFWLPGTGFNEIEWGSSWGVNYGTTGHQTFRLITEDVHGCRDTAFVPLKLYKPQASFTSDTVDGCVPLPIQFQDLSTGDTPIVSWFWNFGDGGFATVANPTHTYSATSNDSFNVRLIVSDLLGCLDTLTQEAYINVYKPPSFFLLTDATLCIGQSLQVGSVPADYQYLWDFGNGDTDTARFTQYSYSAGGQYSVSLTVIDSFGCDSTFTWPIPVEVQSFENMGVIADPGDTTCYPARIRLVDTANLPITTQWTWDFGDGSNPVTNAAPVIYHTYQRPGSFDIRLIVQSTFGCLDTFDFPDVVSIRGPFAKLEANPDTACWGAPVQFLADSAINVAQLNFDFGDGNGSQQPGNQLVASHAYQQEGWVTAYLLYEDTLGVCPKVDSTRVWIDRVTASLSFADSSGCLPYTFGALDLSYGSNQRTWFTGTGDTAQTDSLVYTYPSTGSYEVQLIVWNDTSFCYDTADVPILVYPEPPITLTADQILCEGDSILLSAQGGISYQWSPTTGLSTPDAGTTWAVPTDSITYTVTVQDANNCQNEDSVRLDVQFPVNLLTFPEDTLVHWRSLCGFCLHRSASDSFLDAWFQPGLRYLRYTTGYAFRGYPVLLILQ